MSNPPSRPIRRRSPRLSDPVTNGGVSVVYPARRPPVHAIAGLLAQKCEPALQTPENAAYTERGSSPLPPCPRGRGDWLKSTPACAGSRFLKRNVSRICVPLAGVLVFGGRQASSVTRCGCGGLFAVCGRAGYGSAHTVGVGGAGMRLAVAVGVPRGSYGCSGDCPLWGALIMVTLTLTRSEVYEEWVWRSHYKYLDACEDSTDAEVRKRVRMITKLLARWQRGW